MHLFLEEATAVLAELQFFFENELQLLWNGAAALETVTMFANCFVTRSAQGASLLST